MKRKPNTAALVALNAKTVPFASVGLQRATVEAGHAARWRRAVRSRSLVAARRRWLMVCTSGSVSGVAETWDVSLDYRAGALLEWYRLAGLRPPDDVVVAASAQAERRRRCGCRWCSPDELAPAGP